MGNNILSPLKIAQQDESELRQRSTFDRKRTTKVNLSTSLPNTFPNPEDANKAKSRLVSYQNKTWSLLQSSVFTDKKGLNLSSVKPLQDFVRNAQSDRLKSLLDNRASVVAVMAFLTLHLSLDLILP